MRKWMKRHFSGNFYAQVWWIMARKTVLSNTMLVFYSVLLFLALSYWVGSIIYYCDPRIGVLLDMPKKHPSVNRFFVGAFVVCVPLILIAWIALLREVYEKSKIEVLQKMEHDEKARRIGLK
jgi:hypothetical protein